MLTTTQLAVVAIVNLILLIHVGWHVWFARLQKSLSLPGDAGLPLIGDSIQFASDPRRFLVDGHRRHGAAFVAVLFGRPTIFVLDAADAKQIYAGEGRLVQFELPPSVRAVFADSILTQAGS